MLGCQKNSWFPPSAAGQTAPAVLRVTGATGFNLLLNNGSVAGQEVPHAHLHIIPRFVDDKVLLGASQKKYEGEELDEMKEKIQAKIAAREEGA